MIDQLTPPTPLTNTLYAQLKRHVERHAYKRGKYKGDAPADATKRWKDHFRVQAFTNYMAVLFHNTHIICAYPDGTIILDAGGWDSSPTTRDAFGVFSIWLRSERRGSHSQTALAPCRHYKGPVTPYYDGMTLGPDGSLLTKPRPFVARVSDREARKEFRNDPDVQAFRAALPVLHASISAIPYREQRELAYSRSVRRLDEVTFANGEMWPVLVAKYIRDTPQDTWAAIYYECTKDMTQMVEVK